MEKRLNNTLHFLDLEEWEQFLVELLIAIKKAEKTKNFSLIGECIEDWIDNAELNSIPNLKENVWKRFNELTSSGKID